jgi:3-hydroxybutyrate dehydrogenase
MSAPVLVDLKGRSALVTGGGRGIGRGIALSLANAGARVVLTARRTDELDAVASEIRAAGGEASTVSADLLADGGVDAIVQHAGAIDILVNNAGGNQGAIAFGKTDPDAWWRTVELNLRAPYLLCRAIVPKMVERGWGRVVNIGSVGSKVGLMMLTDYCAAKHGLIGLTRSLALEVAKKGVTVNAVCPGYVETELARAGLEQRAPMVKMTAQELAETYVKNIPQRAAILPEEVADVVLFLCSRGGGRLTGEAINVAGGQVMH